MVTKSKCIVHIFVCPLIHLPSKTSLLFGPRQVTPIQGQLETLVIREKMEVTSTVSVLDSGEHYHLIML